MRVNVYDADVRERVMVDHATPKNAPDVTFTCIEFLVGDPVEHTPGDDDSSVVRFWYSNTHTHGLLRKAFTKALELLDENPPN